MQNADDIKFRCSSLSHLMTKSGRKSETLSESTKTHLVDIFVSAKYDRREELHNKFLDKGNAREEDSITLLSRVQKKFFKKNDIRLENDFISGECDIFLGESIHAATETFDTKTSWSAHTFFRSSNKDLDKAYYWQGLGYMWLTGAQRHTVAYCLVNGTQEAIMQEKTKAQWLRLSESDYKRQCKQIEKNHIYDIEHFKKENPFFQFDNDIENWHWDIPIEERLFTFTFERNEKDIERLEKRIVEARKYMNENLFKTK